MTEAEKEREAIVRYIGSHATTAGFDGVRFRTRLRAAWLAFKSPTSLPGGTSKIMARQIAQGDHHKDSK